MSPKKKALVVTGGSQGIGRAIIGKFLQEEWAAFNLSRRPCDCSGVINIATDLSSIKNLQDVAHVFSLTDWTVFDRICLVHNAADYLAGSVLSLDVERFKASLDTNLFSPILLNQYFAPKMQSGSSIIYMGSTLSEKAVPGAAPYIMAKHVLLGLMRSSCQDFVGSGIHSVLVCPGPTDTQMLREHAGGLAKLEQLAALNAFSRLLKPEEIADIVCFSANSPALNGAVVHANLGERQV